LYLLQLRRGLKEKRAQKENIIFFLIILGVLEICHNE